MMKIREKEKEKIVLHYIYIKILYIFFLLFSLIFLNFLSLKFSLKKKTFFGNQPWHQGNDFCIFDYLIKILNKIKCK